MRKTALVLSLLLATGAAMAQEKVTVQMKWVPQGHHYLFGTAIAGH